MIRTPYALVYGLQESALLKSVLKRVKEDVGIPLVFVGSHYKVWRYNGQCRFCTPGEWINLYMHAHAVVTSSFHGTVFSLLFNKPFVCVALAGRWREKNVRMQELLEALHAPKRFAESPADIGSLCTTPPLPDASPHLERLRQTSTEFLNTSLNTSTTRTGQ